MRLGSELDTDVRTNVVHDLEQMLSSASRLVTIQFE